jgi:hypothetical protein
MSEDVFLRVAIDEAKRGLAEGGIARNPDLWNEEIGV